MKNIPQSLIIILTSFCIGLMYSSYFPFPIQKEGFTNPGIISGGDDLDLNDFWNVYGIIQSEYHGKTDIAKQELVHGAIKGMVDSLGDKHSEFMDPDTTKRFEESLSGDFQGIGAVVEKTILGVEVERILKGSPAKKYGVRSGDIITHANRVELAPLNIYDAVDVIKGPAGTEVELEILRQGEDSVITLIVERDKIHIPSVEQEFFGDIAYISLNMYGDTASQEFEDALDDAQEKESQGLIIDLRDNGGGYLQSAVEILSHFIPSGELLVETRYKDPRLNQKYYSIGGKQGEENFNKKVVVLINGNSASASEITAGALRDYNKAILVGETSFGKGSVQQPFELYDGSLLKLTVAQWVTPGGKNINEGGIDPDIEIHFNEEDYENKYDRQLEEAKKILKTFIEKGSIGLTIEEYNSHTQ